MSAFHAYEYSIRRGIAVTPAGAVSVPKPTPADMARIAEEVRAFMSFYDNQVRIEISRTGIRADSVEAPPRLRVVTSVGNADIVDSAVRVCSLRWRLLPARIEGARPRARPPAWRMPGLGLLGAIGRLFH